MKGRKLRMALMFFKYLLGFVQSCFDKITVILFTKHMYKLKSLTFAFHDEPHNSNLYTAGNLFSPIFTYSIVNTLSTVLHFVLILDMLNMNGPQTVHVKASYISFFNGQNSALLNVHNFSVLFDRQESHSPKLRILNYNLSFQTLAAIFTLTEKLSCLIL